MSGVLAYGLSGAESEARGAEWEDEIERYALVIRGYAPQIEENGLEGEDDASESEECAVEV